jgi:hypothetical protein
MALADAVVHNGPAPRGLRPAQDAARRTKAVAARGATWHTRRQGRGVLKLAEPAAKRLQRPSWRNTRLLVGLVLILLGTALGAKVVASADDTVPMYAALAGIRPGDHLGAENLRRVDVQLGDEAARYLSARAAVPEDSYALREVPEGELIPASAVAGRSAVTVQAVTVEVDANSARTLPQNAVVDVWVSPRDPQSTQERYLDATLALQRVSVSPVTQDSGRFGASSSTMAVQLRVPRDKVAEVIGAVDKQARFTLVPVPGQSS